MPELPEIVTRSRMRARGVPTRTTRRLVSTGELLEPVPGVLVRAAELTPTLVARAALERAGEGAGLSHQSGAARWIGRALSGTTHIRLPPGRRVRDVPGVRHHQSSRPYELRILDGLPVVAADQAGADVAASDELTEADRRALATALVQQGRTSAEAIAEACAAASLRRRAQVRRLVEELLAGALSGPEAAIWRGQVEARMPVPVLNHPVGRRYLDGYLASLRAGYEVQSRTHHAHSWLADMERLGEVLVEHNVPLLPLLVSDIETRLDRVLTALEGWWRNRAADLQLPFPRHLPPPRWEP